MKLAEMCSLIRSKNVGPFTLTFDVMFDSAEKYRAAKASDTFNRRAVAAIYQVSENALEWFECDRITSIKFSIPRPIFQADIGDGDMHGGQQYAPLLDLEIPYPAAVTKPAGRRTRK